MAEQRVYREFCRRQHKILANFLMIRCWKAGAEFAAIDREALEAWLQISRFETVRKKWLEEDFGFLFPYCKFLEYSGSPTKFAALYVSRANLNDAWLPDPMTDKRRIEKLSQAGLKGILIERSDLLSEKELVRELSLLSTGISDLEF